MNYISRHLKLFTILLYIILQSLEILLIRDTAIIRNTGSPRIIMHFIAVGNLLLVLFLYNVISKLRRKEKVTNETFHNFMDLAGEGFTIWDKELSLKFLNSKAKGIYKEIAKEKRPQNLKVFDIFPKLKEDYSFLSFINKQGVEYYNNMNYLIVGEDRNYSLVMKFFRIEYGYGLIVNNITDEILREKKLKEMTIKANEASIAKSEFMENMSHELRTPLNGIYGLTQVLLSSHLPKEEKKYVDMIKRCGDSLIKIVDDILNFSKIQSKHIGIESTTFSLKKLINEIFTSYRPVSVDKGVDFTFEIDKEIPDTLIGDKNKLKQILMNILSNAFKFTSDGFIKISCSIIDKNNKILLMFTVKDSGIGIPLKGVERVFEKFYQIDSSISKKFEGTGLGLAITKDLIKLLKGEIGIKSDEGKGTEVWFSLGFGFEVPAIKEKIKKALNILVVDDNKVNIMVAENILKKMGHLTYSARNGKDAIESLKNKKFNLVLMDIQMPLMDGKTTTKAIRNGASGDEKRDIPIFAMTANCSPEATRSYFNAGFNGIIPKPVSRNAISKELDKVK